MAHPQPPQFSPPPSAHFSPHVSPAPTPPLQTSYPGVPPKGRAPISPVPGSPYTPGSPSVGSPQIPNGQPFPFPPNGYVPLPNTPQTPTANVMGPPSRPVEEKPADLNDLSDVLFSTGIDIRSEEAALVQRNYSQQHGSFETVTGSFNSGSSGPYFDNTPYLSQNTVGDRSSFYGAGTLNQPPVTPESVEIAAERARKEAIRNRVIGMQYELKDPFLYSRAIYKKLLRSAKANQVKYPDGRAVHLNEISVAHYQTAINRLPPPEFGIDEHLIAVDRVGTNAVLPSNGAIADVATLLSLAAKERIRSLLEETAALARGRRINANGIVPVDLKDIATGRGEPMEVPAVSPQTNTLKRSFSEMNGALPSPADSKSEKTVAYTNVLAKALMKSSEPENTLEEARAAKRNKRNVESMFSGEVSRVASTAGTPAPGTPGTPGERAPDVPKKGLSKKEQKRQADAKASEAQQHAATSSSLSMALGGGNLFGGKKISWMSSKKPAMESAFGSPRVPPAQKAAAANKQAAVGRKLGQFREDKEDGSGIQMRDMIAVLDAEPKEKKALAKAFHKLGVGTKK